VSKLSFTSLIFVDPRIIVNGAYYCDVHNSCCLPYVRSLVSSLSFSKTLPQCTEYVRRSTSLSARHLHSSRQICGRLITLNSIQLTTKSGASASLNKSAGCGRFEASWNATTIIDDAIEWHRRLRTCIQAIAGHFEYSL